MLLAFAVIVIAEEVTNSLEGSVNVNSGHCSKDQVIWFRENYGNINPKVYWDRIAKKWEMAFYKDDGELFDIPSFKNDYGFPSYAPNEDSVNKLLSDEKKQEYAEYYACVWMRRVYEKYEGVEMTRPPILEINIDLSNVK